MTLHPTTAFFALTLAACGTTSPPSGDVPPSSRDGAVDDASDAAVCTERPDVPGVVCVRRVRGRALDFSGAPMANKVITYCGGTCWGASTDTMGNFVVDVNDFVIPSRYSVLVHARPEHASLYLPSPTPVDGVIAFTAPLRVPRYTELGAAMPDGRTGGTVAVGDISLTVEPDTMIEYDIEDDKLGALGRRLRVVYIEPADHPQFAREAGLGAVWALAPFGLKASRPIAVRVANRARLAAGTRVDFVAMGQEFVEDPITGGQAVVAAEGVVSADGMFVTTTPGSGIRFMTWLGVRARR
jgi:hypothetical protein